MVYSGRAWTTIQIILLSASVITPSPNSLWFEHEITDYKRNRADLLSFTSRILHSDAQAACEEDAKLSEENLQDIGISCECKRAKYGVVLICIDDCAYCNEDESVCGLQSAQAFYEHDTGERSAIGGVFEYVTGLKDTVAVENLGCTEENGSIVSCETCNVYVNGEKCNSCELAECDNGARAELIDCENIETNALFNFCDSVEIDEGVFQALSTTGFEECLPLDVLGSKRSKSSKQSKKGKGKRTSSSIFTDAYSDSSGSSQRGYRSAKKRKSRRALR